VVLTTKAITEEQGKGFALGAAELEGKAAGSKPSHVRTKGIRSPVPTTVFCKGNLRSRAFQRATPIEINESTLKKLLYQ
jgi:hypothetical protein